VEALDQLRWTTPNLSLSPWSVGFEVNPYREEFFQSPERAFPMLRHLRERPTAPSTVAADLNAGHLILGFTPHFVLATHPQTHGMAVTDQTAREELLQSIYDETPPSAIRDGLRRYGVSYIVWDRRRPDGIGSPRWSEKFVAAGGRVTHLDDEYLVMELPP
jgi:hypothetical protein